MRTIREIANSSSARTHHHGHFSMEIDRLLIMHHCIHCNRARPRTSDIDVVNLSTVMRERRQVVAFST